MMTLLGHIRDGQIIPDDPVALPEGAQVRIEIVPAPGAVNLSERGIAQTKLPICAAG